MERNNIYNAILGYFSDQNNVTKEKLDKAINDIQTLNDQDKTWIQNKLYQYFDINIGGVKIIEGGQRRRPWLNEYKETNDVQWRFWGDYRNYLQKKKHLPPTVIEELDHITDITLDKLFDPTVDDIRICKKGMVVGSVQSGKTSNYTALMCKAADVGFNLFIILAGMHNNLRSQTQLRLDEGILGFDTQYLRAAENGIEYIGVGACNPNHAIAHSYTTSAEQGDFTRSAATVHAAGFNFHTHEPIILVVKKNTYVLNNLYKWLKLKSRDGKINYKSVLVIDDEADNASINTNKPNQDPTRINGHINNIISLFDKIGYVGYTATPFANIFIRQDTRDLFPRDFIINLPTPSNYIGPRRLFGIGEFDKDESQTIIPMIRVIHDHNDFVPNGHHIDDPFPTYNMIPQSLKDAILNFILTCTIRRMRGQGNEHNSMLIHISRFQIWQNEIKELVEQLLKFYKQEIEAGDKKIYKKLKSLYQEDSDSNMSYVSTSKYFNDDEDLRKLEPNIHIYTWDEVKSNICNAVRKIEVKAINGTSGDALSYYNAQKIGISVIVIGGDKLSRGLTLEGLSVSYFLRASRMYDTLMQMGRWFGYRPGYADLCRLYTSAELVDYFKHISIASEELREEFNYMADAGSTPENFALKVRTHPGRLFITDLTKMRNTRRFDLSWSGRLVEAYQLSMDADQILSNITTTNNLLNAITSDRDYQKISKGYLWKGTSATNVLEFLENFRPYERPQSVDRELICQYIRELNKDGELSTWNIVLMSKQNTPYTYTYGNGITVGLVQRTRTQAADNNIYEMRNSHILGGQTDELVDIDEDVKQKALQRTIEIKAMSGEEWKNPFPSSTIVRQEFRSVNEPLLLIYTLDPYYANPIDDNNKVIQDQIQYQHTDTPFIGVAIAFPTSETSHVVGYVIGDDYTTSFIQSEDDFIREDDNIDDENNNTI